jgi:hypothetical protein
VQFETTEIAHKAYEACSMSNKSLNLQINQNKDEADERNFDPKLGWKEALTYKP